MAHSINVYQPERLREVGVTVEQVTDIVNMYFRGSNKTFVIVIAECPAVTAESRSKNFITAGLHRYGNLRDTHEIYLDPTAMKKCMSLKLGLGGNLKPLDLKHGFCMALVHELQHANQSNARAEGINISREGGYFKRGSERDARNAADAAYHELASYLGYHIPDKVEPEKATDEETYGELIQIAESLSDIGKVSIRDLNTELRLSGINTPENISSLRAILIDIGVEVTR